MITSLTVNALHVLVGVEPGVRADVRLEPDPQPDPAGHPTARVTVTSHNGGAAPTDPPMGVSRRGGCAVGGRR
jgi:hypothetical protein